VPYKPKVEHLKRTFCSQAHTKRPKPNENDQEFQRRVCPASVIRVQVFSAQPQPANSIIMRKLLKKATTTLGSWLAPSLPCSIS